MQAPKLSLVVPTLRRPDSVDRLLASLLLQDFNLAELEVIIAMNVRDLEQEQRLVKWAHKLNVRGVSTGVLGVNKARNLGIESATGEIILLLDDDMELLQSDILRKHVEYHADASLAGVGGNCSMPTGATLSALAYHIIGLSWMYRYRRTDGTTPYLLGGHASYKRKVFDEGARFNSEIEFGAAETEFNLRLHNSGARMIYAMELRPIHHNDVKPRNFVRKAYLQGFNGALRKESVAAPKPVLKHHVAVKFITEEENPGTWQRPLLRLYYDTYDWAAAEGRRAALKQPGSKIKNNFVRWLAGVK